MGRSDPRHTTLSATELEILAATLNAQASRMTAAQILDLADQLHDMIRIRQAVERRLALRDTRRPVEPASFAPRSS